MDGDTMAGGMEKCAQLGPGQQKKKAVASDRTPEPHFKVARRTFLQASTLACASTLSAAQPGRTVRELNADLVVIGAGLGGCAAGLSHSVLHAHIEV